MSYRILNLVGTVLLMFCAVWSRDRLSDLDTHRAVSDQLDEVLYLPNGRGLRLLSLGYNKVLSHSLWFRAISYFGRHYSTDRDYQWLDHMCTLVTDLDPESRHVYQFCSTMLSWEAGKPEASVRLLERAAQVYPQDWEFPYFKGFVLMYFLKDEAAAAREFVRASRLPDAHPLVKRLAAKKLIQSEDPETAVEFLSDLLRREREPKAREALEDRLKQARLELDIVRLEKAVEIFEARTGRRPAGLEELVAEGIVAVIPQDPYGGSYSYEGEPKQVRSSSEARLGKLRIARTVSESRDTK